MTTPKSTLRPRRQTGPETLPRDLVAWFEGEPRRADQSQIPWSALVFPDHELLGVRWKIWKAAHPDAVPPPGYEWIADPDSPRHPAAWLLAQAQACARQGKRK
jgi:hypothetical protein